MHNYESRVKHQTVRGNVLHRGQICSEARCVWIKVKQNNTLTCTQSYIISCLTVLSVWFMFIFEAIFLHDYV